MADGGQRLLDVIDDPNALESFLGSLTSDDILHSGAVNNVVEQLTSSLAQEYDIDSPSDTLFDTLESSGNLTDISQSTVPFDFGGDHILDSYSINSVGNTSSLSSNGPGQFDLNTNEQLHQLQMQQQQQNFNLSTSNACDSSSFNLLSSSNANNTLPNTSNSTFSNSLVSGSSSNSSSVLYSTSGASGSVIIGQQHQHTLSANGHLVQQHQEHVQMSSLSSTSMVQSQSHSSSITASSGMISTSQSSGNQNQPQVTFNGMLSFPEQNQADAGQKQQTETKTSEMPALSTANQQTASTSQLQFTSAAGSVSTPSISASNAPAQQAITTAQFANLNLTQLVQQAQQAQAMGQQIISTGGGLQLQATQQPSFFIDANGQIMAAAGGATGISSFGTSNLALVATAGGVQPYAVLAQPSAQQLFSNAITMQPQTTTIQSIKNPNGSTTYFQTNTPQIIGTNPLQQTTTAGVVGSVANNLQSSIIRPKPPPQLLPKPSATATKSTPTSSVSKPGTPTGTSSTATSSSTGSIDRGISSTNSSTSSNGLTTSVTTNNTVIGSTNTSTLGSVVTSLATPITTNSISIDTLGQLFQQHGQQAISTSGLTFTQPSFAIGPNGMVVSGVNNLNAMAAGHQALILNQMGQQMIVPTAQGGFQILLRQQPSQPQLVIQSPTLGAQAAGNAKPIIRYVTAQNSLNSLQVQQPQFIIRTMPTQIQTQTQSQSQPQTQSAPVTPVATPLPSQTPEARKTVTPQPPQIQKPIRAPTPTPVNNKKSEPSPEPPKKKAKQIKKKEKVTIDLNDLFKKAGIDSGDFEDDGFDFFDSSETTPSQNGIQQDQTKLNGAANNNNTITPPLIHGLPHVRVLEPVDKTKQRKPATPKGRGKAQQQTTPPPATPAPKTPQVTLPAPPKPVIGKDGKVIYLEPPIINLDVPLPPEDSTASKPKKSKSKAKKVEPEPPPVPSPSPPPPPSKKKKYPSKKTEPAATNHVVNNLNLKPLGPPPPIPLISAPAPRSVPVTTAAAPTPAVTTASPVAVGSTQFGAAPRMVSLSPQNQQLLRNIQIQINRLVTKPSRNETEETALQKLRELQQQVIATGVTVPNPPHVQTLNTTQAVVATSTTGLTVLSTSNPSAASSSVISTSKPLGTGSLPEAPSESTQHILLKSSSSPRGSGSIIFSQPPPLILSNKVITSSASSSGQAAQPESNTSIVAVTTDPTTKRAYIISVAKSGVSAPPPATNTSMSSDVSSPAAIPGGDKVTSATGTTTTTTISTSSGAIRQYHYQFPTPQQQTPPVLIRTLADDKNAEELRLAKQKQEEEARVKWKKEQFEARYQKDQDNFLSPDFKTPFSSLKDMAERLSSFHIARERREMEFEEFDQDFSETACHLLDKFNGMVAKYKALVLRDSMREVPCCEHVMLERVFVGEERASLEQDRSLVADGEILELPPPPPSWIPQIEEYVETELKEMERDSIVNQQVQSAIDSITTFGNNDSSNYALPDECEKIEVDAFGVPISSSGYNGMNSSSADIDEAVKSILF